MPLIVYIRQGIYQDWRTIPAPSLTPREGEVSQAGSVPVIQVAAYGQRRSRNEAWIPGACAEDGASTTVLRGVAGDPEEPEHHAEALGGEGMDEPGPSGPRAQIRVALAHRI